MTVTTPITMANDRLERCIAGLYEAAVEPERWVGAVNAIADAIGAQSTHVMAYDVAAGAETIGFLEGADPAAYQDYLDTFLAMDLRVPRMLAAPVGRILRNQDVWSEEERLASPVYQEFQRPNAIFEITGAQLGIGGHLSWFGVGRRREEPFGPEELAVIARVIPNVRQALRIALAFREQGATMRALGEVWSRGGRGVVVLAPGGRVTFVNAEAEAMARAGLFRLGADRLVFAQNRLAVELGHALDALGRGGAACSPDAGAGHAGILASPEGGEIGVRFLPLLAGDGQGGSSLVVLLIPLSRDPRPDPGEIAQFATLFGLTGAEQAVVGAIAAGRDIAAHALERGIALDTARKHLKTVLAKTACRSQKDLTRLIERFCFLRLR